MGEMVERVAKAIFNASVKTAGRSVLWEDHDNNWPSFETRSEAKSCARAAIAAMREPTEAMIDKAEDLDDWGTSDDPGAGNAGAKVHWQAMIDEALKP